ncbi:MAG: hypothetical protein AB1656_01750 [Candidatus Omnitrophota bacterium]
MFSISISQRIVLVIAMGMFLCVSAQAQEVVVYDASGDSADLTGQTDFDDLDARQLAVHWNYAGDLPVTEWHVYVKRGDGGYFYLGRAGDGAARDYVWNNPDVNTQYQFRVWGLYKNESGQSQRVVLSQAGPMGYNLTGGSAIKLKKIANPDDLADGKAIVTDDLFHGTDLSVGEDKDATLERALALKWNPGAGDFYDCHAFVSTDGVNYSFLGQTGASDLFYFRFDANETFLLDAAWKDGPQSGVTYWFRLYALKNDGGRVIMNAGPVAFNLESTATLTPTPTPILHKFESFAMNFDSISQLPGGGISTVTSSVETKNQLIAEGRMPADNEIYPWTIITTGADPSYGVASSEPHSAGFNAERAGFYQSWQTSVLEIERVFDTTLAENPAISFDIAFSFDIPISIIEDFLVVEILKDGETAWQLLDINGDGQIVTDRNALGTGVLSTGSFDGLFGLSNPQKGPFDTLTKEDFIHVEANLPATKSLKIALRFQSDASFTAEGAYLDNIQVYDKGASADSTPTPTLAPTPAPTLTPTPTATPTP